MTGLLWSAFGLTVVAAVLHGTLGLRRPVEHTYLSFAYIMVFLAAYLYFEWTLYRSLMTSSAVEAVRRQLIAAHGFFACILVFVPAYTKVHVPPRLMAAFWFVLGVLFLANLVMPYGIWFSAEPELVTVTFRGQPYTTVISPPLALPQYLHEVFFLSLVALTFWCSIQLFRRGQRRRGVSLTIAVLLVAALHAVDLVREAIGATWPYLGEFGVVAWGAIMSVQLAIDFRIAEQRLNATLRRVERDRAELRAMVDTTLHVRDKLNTPLQTLELGLAVRAANTPRDVVTLANLRRAVTELTELGRAIELTAHPERRR